MVANLTLSKILRIFEKYLIAQTDFQLVANYDLILLIPEQSSYWDKYSWLISSKFLDKISQEKFVEDIFHKLKDQLSFEEYSSIARVNKLSSNETLVKNINFLFPFEEEMIEINNIQVGGFFLDKGILVRSKILNKLRGGRATTITLVDGKRINAGIISIDANFNIKHWTGKGLRELFAPDRNAEEVRVGEEIKNQGEDYLIANQYITFTNLDDIEDVY